MAIVINGDGSISGISAGGLPTGSVTADTLATNSVDSDELVSGAIDAGHLASGVGGITSSSTFRLNADTNLSTNSDITANWEEVDTEDYTSLGTAVTESSGIFSFPATGYWLISANMYIVMNPGPDTADVKYEVTVNNSAYTQRAKFGAGVEGGRNSTAAGTYLLDVTDISNVKCKFVTSSFATGTYLRGTTSSSESCVTFTRLGDT